MGVMLRESGEGLLAELGGPLRADHGGVQILIRKCKHFAEDAKPGAWSDLKWSARPRRGDVVEVREAGYWRIERLGTGVHGWDREAFALIEATGPAVGTVRAWAGSYSDATETQPATMQFKNRRRFPLWEAIPWVKQVVMVGGVTVEEWSYVRVGLIAATIPADKVT